MSDDISAALKSGFVVCEMISASPPWIRIGWLNHECTALVRHALLVSLWTNKVVVVTSSVLLKHEAKDVLVVLGFRAATPSDRPAASPANRALVEGSVPPPVDPSVQRTSTPIAALCARRGSLVDITCEVVFKGQPTPFKNGTGESIVFEFEDSSGRIRAISFSPDCHILDARIHVGGRYRIRGGKCKKADARFNPAGHDYELILDANVRVADEKHVS